MRNLFKWREHPDIVQFVMRDYPKLGVSQTASRIRDRWGIVLSPGAIRGFYCDEKQRSGLPALPSEPEPELLPAADDQHPDQRQPMEDRDVAEMYRLAMEQVELKEATFLGQTEATVNLSHLKEPIGICFWSDWQLGTHGVLMRQLLEDADTIRDADGLYTYVMGDLMQNLNQRKHPQSMSEEVVADPRDQEELVKYVLRRPLDKILGMLTGNHEENLKQASGMTLTERWCRELGKTYLWHGAKVTLTLGQQTYKLGLRHKYTNESSINTTNTQRNMHLRLWPDADVICLGHRHYNDLQKTPRPLVGETVWLRAGSYQATDDYGMSVGQYRGSWGVPMVILFPDEKKVLPIYGRDFHLGLQILADQRRRYRER